MVLSELNHFSIQITVENSKVLKDFLQPSTWNIISCINNQLPFGASGLWHPQHSPSQKYFSSSTASVQCSRHRVVVRTVKRQRRANGVEKLGDGSGWERQSRKEDDGEQDNGDLRLFSLHNKDAFWSFETGLRREWLQGLCVASSPQSEMHMGCVQLLRRPCTESIPLLPLSSAVLVEQQHSFRQPVRLRLASSGCSGQKWGVEESPGSCPRKAGPEHEWGSCPRKAGPGQEEDWACTSCRSSVPPPPLKWWPWGYLRDPCGHWDEDEEGDGDRAGGGAGSMEHWRPPLYEAFQGVPWEEHPSALLPGLQSDPDSCSPELPSSSPGDKPCPAGGTGTFPQVQCESARRCAGSGRTRVTAFNAFLRKVFHNTAAYIIKMRNMGHEMLFPSKHPFYNYHALSPRRERVCGCCVMVISCTPTDSQDMQLSPPHLPCYQRDLIRLA